MSPMEEKRKEKQEKEDQANRRSLDGTTENVGQAHDEHATR